MVDEEIVVLEARDLQGPIGDQFENACRSTLRVGSAPPGRTSRESLGDLREAQAESRYDCDHGDGEYSPAAWERMDSARWKQVDSLRHLVLKHSAGERAGFLRHACAGDEELERAVQFPSHPSTRRAASYCLRAIDSSCEPGLREFLFTAFRSADCEPHPRPDLQSALRVPDQ